MFRICPAYFDYAAWNSGDFRRQTEELGDEEVKKLGIFAACTGYGFNRLQYIDEIRDIKGRRA